MKMCRDIIGAFLLFISFSATGQGSVIVHSDPRLAILLQKVHPEPVAPAPAHRSEAKLLASASIPVLKKDQPVASVNNAVAVSGNSSGGRSADEHVVRAEQPAAKPVVAAAAHVHLWTPPVLPRAKTVTMGKGFRVQIYNGADRTKAIEVKAEFMRAHPAVRTYLNYIAPHFRVKVGDYRNRGEAATMLREVNKKYSPSMIVPDIVTITTF